MKKSWILFTLYCMGIGSAWSADLSRQRDNSIESFEVFKIEQHEVLSGIMEQLQSLGVTDIEKSLPLYFGILDYVRKHPDPKPMVKINYVNDIHFIDPKFFVYTELAKLASQGVFNSTPSYVQGVNALISEIYPEAIIQGNISVLDQHIEKMIISPQRSEMFQTVISYYLEKAEVSKASYYMSLYKIFAPKKEATLTAYLLTGDWERELKSREENKIFKEERWGSMRTALTHVSGAETDREDSDDGLVTTPQNSDGTYDLNPAFEKHSQWGIPMVFTHSQGFLIENQQFLTAYDSHAKKRWERKLLPSRSGTNAHFLIHEDRVIVNSEPVISILNLNTGQTLFQIDLDQRFPGSLVYGMHAVDQKLYVVTVQNKKKFYAHVINLKNFELKQSIYLAQVMVLGAGYPSSSVNPNMQIHFARWGHMLFISTPLWAIYGVNMEEDSLEVVLCGKDRPGDIQVQNNNLFVCDNDGLFSFDLLEIWGDPQSHRVVGGDNNQIKEILDIRPEGVVVLFKKMDGDGLGVKIIEGSEGQFEEHDIWHPYPNVNLHFIYTKNNIFFYGLGGLFGYGFDAQTGDPAHIVSHSVQAHTDVRDAQIAHGMLFVTTDSSVVAYKLKESNTSYLSELWKSADEKQDRIARIRFLMQFIDEEDPMVRHTVKQALVADLHWSSDILLASLDQVSASAKREMEEVLEEILDRVIYINQYSTDPDFYKTYFDLLVWGYEKIGNEQYKKMVLDFALARKVKEDQMAFKLYSTALEDILPNLREAAILGLTFKVRFGYLDRDLVFDLINSHYDRGESEGVTISIIAYADVFTDEQRKTIYFKAAEDSVATVRKIAIREFFKMIQKSETITAKDVKFICRFFYDEGEEVRKGSLESIFVLLNQKKYEGGDLSPKIVTHFKSEKTVAVRRYILENSAALSKEDQRQLLLAACGDQDPGVRQSSISALPAYLKDNPQYEAEIFTAIDGHYDGIHDESYRKLVVLALADSFSPDHRKTLLMKALNDEFFGIHESAAEDLFAFIDQYPNQKEEVLSTLWSYLDRDQKSEEVVEVLARHGELYSSEQQFHFYVGLLNYSNEEIREKGIQGLLGLIDQGQFKMESLEKLFNHYDKEPIPAQRYKIVFAWGLMPFEDVKSCLLKAASDSDETVRSTAQTFFDSHQSK